ncbi:MAG TPA: hypothetical protein VG778_11730, partial [Blastocatellia bacterium]|nr:hypothetical protein [Blastocatellia bacterium]
AISWVEVPDLSESKLTLSGILLTEGEGTKSMKDAPRADSARWRPIKSYVSGSLLAYYLRLYNMAVGSESETLMQLEISLGGNTVYRSDWQPIAARVLGRDKIGLDMGGQLSVPLKPGLYELGISIRDSNLKHLVQRRVLFAVYI